MQEKEQHMTQKVQSAPCAQGETSCSASVEEENVLQQQRKESETSVRRLRKRPLLNRNEKGSISTVKENVLQQESKESETSVRRLRKGPVLNPNEEASSSTVKENVFQQQSKESITSVRRLRKRTVLNGNEETSSSKRACLDKSSPNEHEKDSFDDLIQKLHEDVKHILATLKDQADNGNKVMLSEFLKQLKRGLSEKTAHARTTSSGPTKTAAPLLLNFEQQSDEIQHKVSNIQKQRSSSSVGGTLRKGRQISDDSSTNKNDYSDCTMTRTYPLRSRRKVAELLCTCEQRNEDNPSDVGKQQVLHADKKTTPSTADNNDGYSNNVCDIIPVLELIPVSNVMKKPRTPSTRTEPLCQTIACFCEVSTTEGNDKLRVTTASPLKSQPQSDGDQVNVCNVQTAVATTLPLTSQQQSDDNRVTVSNVQKTVTTTLPLTSQQQSDGDQVNACNIQTAVTTALSLTSQQQSDDDQVNVCNVQTAVTTTPPLTSQQQSDGQVTVSDVLKTVITALPLTSQQQSDNAQVTVCNIQAAVKTTLPLSFQQLQQQSDQVNVSDVQKPPMTSTGTETSREIVASSCNFSTAEDDNDPKRNAPAQRYDNDQASCTDRETSIKGYPDDLSTLENLYNNKIRKYHRYGNHNEEAPERHPEKRLDNIQASVSNIQPPGETSTCSGVSSTVRGNSPDGTSIEKEKECRAAEKALTEQQKIEYARLLPATFRQLRAIMTERSGRPFQNFLAVVSDITPPKKSRGRDHYSKIYIVDPCFSQASLELMWFDQPEYFPNIYRPGEIVIWQNVKCQTHRYDLQLIKNTRTRVTVIPWDDDPEIMKTARLPPVSFPEHFRKSVNFLDDWRQKNKHLFNTIPFVDFSKEIDVGVYVNLCVRLCKLAVEENKAVFTVCDGNIPRFSGHDRREDTSNATTTRTWFDVTSEFRATELIDINVKGEFGMRDNISKYSLKARDVIAFYGVFVKRSKRGNIKLVLMKTDIEQQGFIRVKREYVPNPFKRGDRKFDFKKW